MNGEYSINYYENEIKYLKRTLDSYKEGSHYNNLQHMNHIDLLYKEIEDLKNELYFYKNGGIK